MPIYEYICAECGKEFEEIIFGQEQKVSCPKCSSPRTQKMMSKCRTRFGQHSSMGQSTMPASGGGCSSCGGGSCASCG